MFGISFLLVFDTVLTGLEAHVGVCSFVSWCNQAKNVIYDILRHESNGWLEVVDFTILGNSVAFRSYAYGMS